MRRLFSTVVFLMIGVAALGYCRDWFSVTTAEDPLTDQMEVNVHVHKSKIRYDARQAKDAIRSLHRETVDIFDDAGEPAGQDSNP
jgi:hypothetical protein